MELKLNIAKLRGTIFTQQINYSPELVKTFSDILSDYLPSFLTVLPQNNSIPNGVLSNFWELVNPASGERIQFNNIKIDIILNCDQPYSLDAISNFADHCAKVFHKILSVTGHSSSRLAIAPTFSCVDTPLNISKFAQNVFAKSKFKDTAVDNYSFNNIYRVEEKIAGQDILVNYLANFYSANRVDVIDGKNVIRETIAIDFDINTFANDKYAFDSEALLDFFSKSSPMCKSYLDFFFS